jgi:hypothetical protein
MTVRELLETLAASKANMDTEVYMWVKGTEYLVGTISQDGRNIYMLEA